MPTFEVSTEIAAPCEVAFALSLAVDAHAGSMADHAERAVAGVTSGQLRLGDQVTWRARHFGVWWQLTSRITAYEEGHFFVDEQVRGPFARWHHAHRFDPAPSRGTVMNDVITFNAPLGPFGHVAERLFLTQYMKAMIEKRNRYLAAQFL